MARAKTGHDAGTTYREDTPGMKKNQNIEWKKSWRDEYIKWICGFANAAGETLVIGKSTPSQLLNTVPYRASVIWEHRID